MNKRYLVFDTVKGIVSLSLDHFFALEIISMEEDDKFGPTSKALFKFLLPNSTVHTEVYNIPTTRVKFLLQDLTDKLGETHDNIAV